MRISFIIFISLIIIAVLASAFSNLVQRDFGNVEVSDVEIRGPHNSTIRAKLFRHLTTTHKNRGPGVVYIHGYQSNRESSDPFCIELSRRGIVALCIDALGRGNSDLPLPLEHPLHDKTFGTKSAVDYIKTLDFVDTSRIGLMGNSLGGQLAYEYGLYDSSVKLVAFTGYAFDDRATENRPPNMLMIFGSKDEYKNRMLGTDERSGWIKSELVKKVTASDNPKPFVTYGDFQKGTARRIEFPDGIHLAVSHSKAPIASTVEFAQGALTPNPKLALDSKNQIWQFKEVSSLIAMAAGLLCLLPLLSLLLQTPIFKSLKQQEGFFYTVDSKDFKKRFFINTLLMCLYPGLTMVTFAVHIYIIPIDWFFPLMIANGIIFWFFSVNLIGLIVFLKWKKKNRLSTKELGLFISGPYGFSNPIIKTIAAALILFMCAIGLEYILETLFLSDYRFVFPYASVLTFDRSLIALRYYPFVFVAFLGTGIFLHIQMKRDEQGSFIKAFAVESFRNTIILLIPIVLLLLLQYVPLLVADTVILEGPGGGLVSLMMNLFHIAGVLVICIPMSTWCYMYTKTPYLGATLNSAIVTWMYASSQVAAPIPV